MSPFVTEKLQPYSMAAEPEVAMAEIIKTSGFVTSEIFGSPTVHENITLTLLYSKMVSFM